MSAEGAAGSLVGQTIGGRYRLTELLGQGGMGEVYAAEHIHITKRVAVKLLLREISDNEQAVARFKQEAQSASSIGHDNIVRIDDFFELDDGRVCMCMEFLQGQSLASVIHQLGTHEPARAVEIMCQVCEGLAAAHALGIIHRDMKPENVFLTRLSDGRERVKILDFGIAKVVGGEASNLTKTGTVFGTPHYMSPEQALGHPVDPRADVYALGVIMFEMFAGQVPFRAESFMGVLSKHITEPAPSPSGVTPGVVVPEAIEQIILKAMAKKPELRFATVTELREALLTAAAELGWVQGARAALPPTRRGAVTPTGKPVGGGTKAAIVRTGPSTPAAAVEVASAPTMASGELQRPAGERSPSIDERATKKERGPGLAIAIFAGAVLLLGIGIVVALTRDRGGSGARSGLSAPIDASGERSSPAADASTTGASHTRDAAVTGALRPNDAQTTDAGPAVASPVDAAQHVGQRSPSAGSRDAGTQLSGGPDARAGRRPPAPDARVSRPKRDARVRRQRPDARPLVRKREVYTVKIVSTPSDAAVYRDGRKLRQRTPLALDLRPGEVVELRLAKGGRRDQTITVRGEARDRTVRIKLKARSFGGGGSELGIPGSDPGIPGGGGL